MLEKIYGFFGIQKKAVRRNQLVCRLWYVHNMDLAEAFRSEFYDAVIDAKRAVEIGKGVESYEKK